MSAQSTTWSRLPSLAARLAALDQAPVSSLWVDDQGIIGYSNDLFSAATGYSQEELPGTTLDCLLPALTLEQWCQDWWPLLEQERQLPVFPLSWRHSKGVGLSYTASVSLVAVASLQFAVFYLWPIPLQHDPVGTSIDNDATRLLQSLGESVCMVDEFGIIRFVNKAFCKLTAANQADLLGTPLLELIAPEKSQLTKVWNVLNQQQTTTACEFRNLAGKTLHIRITAVPLQDAENSSASHLVSFIDISEQVKTTRQLADQNASYERLAANLPGFIYKFRMTPEGEFSFPYASRGCKDIFGIDPSAVVMDATPIIQTIHPEDLPKFQNSVLNSAMHLSPWNFEARQITADGDWKWFHAASRPELQENGDILWEGLIMDVTDRKQAEQELARAKQNAEDLAHAKTRFLANMSHEIRTPLHAIIGLNRLILQSELNPVQRDYLQKIQMSSENLLGIVNNILDFSKIESGNLGIEQLEFNLDSVLEYVGMLLEPAAAEKNLQLCIDRCTDLPVLMHGDSLRLAQVLTNLCSNAIKFTRHGEVVMTIRPEAVDDASPRVRFSIKDTGIGMTEQQQKKIFEAFTQADNSTTRNYGGTGLGLTISKYLVELMGGEIAVISNEGTGSEFYFTLPLVNAVDDSRDLHLPDELRDWQLTLIMENDRAGRILAKTLRGLLIDVSVHSLNGTTAEEILKNLPEQQPESKRLILLDCSPGDGHSAKLEETLNNASLAAKTKIIVAISSLQADLIARLSDRANLTFLNKPATPSMLIDAIARATGIESPADRLKISPAVPTNSNHRQALSGIRVLVVEDNAINEEVIRGTLESVNVIVDIVNNGREALERLLPEDSERRYAAVFMDLQMPVMDGFEATDLLRQEKHLDCLPIIAMTAHVSPEDRGKCLAAGMQDHLGKPVDPEQLFDKLARWTGNLPSTTRHNSSQAGPNADAEAAPQALQAIQEALSTVDVGKALQLLQGDVGVLHRLLLQFADQQQQAHEQIRRFIADDQWQLAAARAHQIKGVAGNLQIGRIHEIAGQLEKVLSGRQQARVDALLNQYSEEFHRFARQLENWQDGTTATSATTVSEETSLQDADHHAIELLLEQLLKHLAANSWQAEDCLEQIHCRLNGLYARELSDINRCLLDLEFSAASEHVRKLREQLHYPV